MGANSQSPAIPAVPGDAGGGVGEKDLRCAARAQPMGTMRLEEGRSTGVLVQASVPQF